MSTAPRRRARANDKFRKGRFMKTFLARHLWRKYVSKFCHFQKDIFVTRNNETFSEKSKKYALNEVYEQKFLFAEIFLTVFEI
jgi:hypothetical protein